MSDALSFTELDGQQVELLPARTVLSMFAQGTDGGHAANGIDGIGTLGLKTLGLDIIPGSGNGVGGPGGNANGGTD
ncbi:MAG: hypothetical protein ACRDRI_02990 [Pseudonocardiaceae bacterium]